MVDIFAVKKNYRTYCEKIATLWPIMGRRSLTDDQVIKDIKICRLMWLRRLDELQDYGWNILKRPKRINYIRNCPLSLVRTHTDKISQYCGLDYICPFCHSRHVGKLYDHLCNLLLPKRGKLIKPIRLIELSHTWNRTKEQTGTDLNGSFLALKERVKLSLKSIPSIGSYYQVNLSPYCIEDKQVQWRFKYNILALVDNKYKPEKTNSKRKVRVNDVTCRREMINIISRTCRYQVSYMKGEPSMTITSLSARCGKKITQLTGCFRKKSSTKKEKCNESIGSS